MKTCCWLLCVATAVCVPNGSAASEETNTASPRAGITGATLDARWTSRYAELGAHMIEAGNALLPWPTIPSGEVPPQPRSRAAVPEGLPARLVHVRVSGDLLQEQLRREIKRTDKFADEILDADVHGTADTIGSTRIVLEPRENVASMLVVLRGTVTARSRGYAGPVVIDSESQTEFEARRRFIVSANGVQIQCGPCQAKTSTITNGVKAHHPGVGRRIVERVARRRIEESRVKADQIISEHTLTRINSVFDQELMKVAGPLDQALRGHRFKWTIDGAEHGIRFESTSKYVEVVVQRMSDESGQLSSEPQMDGQSQLAVRAHRAFVQQLLDVGGMVRLQSTLAGLMADPVDQQAFGAMRPQGCKFLWSPDRDWLVLDFFRERSLSDASPAEQPASANVAATRGP